MGPLCRGAGNPALRSEELGTEPPELRTQLYARGRGCDWIRFDPPRQASRPIYRSGGCRDGPVVGLPPRRRPGPLRTHMARHPGRYPRRRTLRSAGRGPRNSTRMRRSRPKRYRPPQPPASVFGGRGLRGCFRQAAFAPRPPPRHHGGEDPSSSSLCATLLTKSTKKSPIACHDPPICAASVRSIVTRNAAST